MIDETFDPYEVLHVRRGATTEQIHAAYRSRARQVHPDVADTGTGDEMAALNLAWLLLRDPQHRPGAGGSDTPEAPCGDRLMSTSATRRLQLLVLWVVVLVSVVFTAMVLYGFAQGVGAAR